MNEPRRQESSFATYSVTLAAVALAVLARWLLNPVLEETLPLVTLFGAVALGAWLGGIRPALLAAILGYAACAYLFIEPGNLGLTKGHHVLGLFAYLFTCSLIIAFAEAMRIAQRRAETQRETLRVTLASIGDAVITTDVDGLITYVNKVAVDITGWDSNEAVGRPLDAVFRIVNEQTRDPVESPVNRALRQGVIVGLANHTILVRKDGTERPIDDSAAPIRDERGEVTGCVLVFRDVTDRRRAERLIDDARRFAESIVQNVRIPLVVLSSDLQVLSANRTYCESFNTTLEAVQHQPFLECDHRQWDVPELRARLSDLLQHNARIENCEIEREFAGIGRRVLEINASRIQGAEAPAELILLAVEDITARRRLEREAAARLASAQFLAAIVESSNDAIITKSLEGVIQSWNVSAERLFGYTAQQAIGRSITMLIPPDRIIEEEQILSRLRAGERVDHFDTIRIRRNGELINVSLTISPIRDEDGQIIGASKIARDITERKDAERRIYELMAELKAADQRKDAFLAMLAHELRGPLAPLRNSLEILKRADDEQLRQQACDTMGRQMGQMVRLVDDLLDVSRIARDKLELRRSQIELASVLQHALETCRPVAELQGHELNVSLPAEPIYLYADSARLAEVFGNLLDNACKYSTSGGKIWLTAVRHGDLATVTVKDAGRGIPPHELQRIFEMFTQVDHSLERPQGGLGLGLALVKRLVEMHGGTVEARSEGENQGSEFIVRLPVLNAPQDPPREATPVEQPRPPGRRILVVDDNRDSATSLSMLLKLSGHEPHAAHDGLAAIEAAENLQPEVVLLDIGLPKLNGHEVCRRIREQPWGQSMFIIALTGWGQDEDRRKSQEAGFNAHLVKPVDFAQLMTMLGDPQSSPATLL